MKLSKFDLCAGWEEVAYPFPRTLAETLFPGVEFAILHADPETDPAGLVAALPEGWHLDFATRARKRGTGGCSSLPFHAFPAEIARALREAEATHVERVAIVGLGYNDYKDDLARFDGSAFTVKFALRPLGGKLRTAALVDGRVLGFVSTETPVRQGVRSLSLRCDGQVVYAQAA